MRIDPGSRKEAPRKVARLAGLLVLGAAALAQGGENSLNLFTRDEGLHAMSLSALAGVSGYTQDELHEWLTAGRYALWSGGALRAWHYDPLARTLYFAAERYDTEHTDRNAYRLYRNWNQADARPMPVVRGEGPAAGAPGVFPESLVLEQDNVYAPWSLIDPDGRYWFWDHVYAGTPDDRITLALELPDPDAAPCGADQRLRVHLRGSSDLSPDGDHQVLGVLNDGPSARAWFDAFSAKVLEIAFEPGVLQAAGNSLELVSELRPGVSQALQRLDRIEVDYCRRSLAVDGQLWLHRSGPGVVTVAGLPGPEIAVIEDPAGPAARWREDLTVVPDGKGGYQVSFMAGAAADFLVAEKAASSAPEAEVDDPQSLASTDYQADYLIIAPQPEMGAAAQALADYRRATLPPGSAVLVVWEQDIYDQFSQRRTDPVAIGRFLSRVLTWSRVPTHVTFLGRGTLNHKGRPDQFPGESLIPVTMASGPWGLFPSDNRYCDTDGDGVPEFACGRIPAEDEADAFAYLDKLEGFESAALGAWMDRAIGIADNLDPTAGDFAADAAVSEQRIAGLGYAVTPLHYNTGDSVAGFRQALVSAWQQGAAIAGYWGHGSADRLGEEDFLPIDDPLSDIDIAGLTNAPRLPVAAGLTCYAGNDAFPGFSAVSAALVANPVGGAVAALMPTGLSLHASAVVLGDHFFDTLAGEGLSVGEAARESKARAAADGSPRWELDLYDVSGEPLLRLR